MVGILEDGAFEGGAVDGVVSAGLIHAKCQAVEEDYRHADAFEPSVVWKF